MNAAGGRGGAGLQRVGRGKSFHALGDLSGEGLSLSVFVLLLLSPSASSPTTCFCFGENRFSSLTRFPSSSSSASFSTRSLARAPFLALSFLFGLFSHCHFFFLRDRKDRQEEKNLQIFAMKKWKNFKISPPIHVGPLWVTRVLPSCSS